MEEKPDLIIGIDFGMTYTGVAWSNVITPEVFVLKDWPGLIQHSPESKVPSKLIYQGSQVSAWGFLCDLQDEYEGQGTIREWFKIYLDPANVERAKSRGLTDAPKSVGEARRLVTNYLREVYNHIKLVMEGMSGPWSRKRVEFVFSMPTTWKNQAILNDFKGAILDAGFGTEESHTAQLELTEAEAVATYTVKSPQLRFAKGDIFLVCDAGGGTTDLGLLEISECSPEMPVIKQVAAVQGAGIGSTMIDRAFQQLVQRRLDEFPDAIPHLPEDLAFRLSRSSQFHNIKHGFGSAALDQETYSLVVDVNRDFVHAGLRIARGKISFSRMDIQDLFDPQVQGIIRQIEKQLDWMKSNRSTEEVKYLILSGGLGGSEYVKSRVVSRFRSNPHPSAPNLFTPTSQEPRLSVAKGLVIDRRQSVTSPSSVLVTRIARASYGVLCRQPYDPAKHPGEEVQFDEYIKGKRWAVNQIDWFVKKGDIIHTNSARDRPFERKLKPGGDASTRIWETTLVVSHNDRNSLPRGLSKQAGATKLCTVTSDLSLVNEREFELKNKRCWQGKKYYLARFTIKVTVAPADLKFELWFKNQKYSRSHKPVTIQWDAAGAAEKPPVDEWDDEFEAPRWRHPPERY